MAINPHFYNFYTLNSNHLDNLSKIKECVHNATKSFLNFCIYFIEPYLENELVKPHLQNINQLCIYETDAYLEVHLANIYTILEKDPTLLEVYMTIIQDLKDVPPNLLELDQIANDPALIQKHFQMIQYIKKLNSSPFLKMHLWTIKMLQNNPNVELYLKSMSALCNFQSQLLKTYLSTNSLICYLEPFILEIHLKNMNSIELSLFKNYINTLCDIKDDLELLKFYIQTIFIIKKNYNLLEIHQGNIQYICKFSSHILKDYLERILQLEGNKTLLEHCIKSTYNINRTQSIQYLEFHFNNIYYINHFHPKLLEPYLQSICYLDLFFLPNYIQTIHSTENCKDRVGIIYYMHNITYISQSQPNLLSIYYTVCQILENNQKDHLFFYNYVVYFISQKCPEALKKYFNIILYLENTHASSSTLYIKNIHSKPDLLVEYISTILLIEMDEKFSSSFYISSIYIAYFITKKHSDLIDLYNASYTILESKQEDLLFHLYHVFYISQKHPQLLQNHLEIVLFLANTYSNLLWPHLKNIQNNYHSDPDFFKTYIFKTSHLKNNPELLFIHICHTFDIHRIKNEQPLLLKAYNLIVKALENNPKSTSCHVYNTYLISVLLPDFLKMYFEIAQKTLFLSRDNPKWRWLNNHIQSIQEFTFQDCIALKKHLQLISQVDAIFEGKMFLIEGILKNMKEEEKKEFISMSPAIMPYVIAKTIFMYIFNDKYNQVDPCFFPSEVKQEIAILRKEIHKYTTSKLQNIFNKLIDFNKHQNEKLLEDNLESLFEKIQVLWINTIQEETNLFMQCWKEAANTLS